MFCYTVVSGIRCVLQELVMWSEISSEHPVFIKTVASLTNKRLPRELTAELDKVREEFSEIKEDAQELLNQMRYSIDDEVDMGMQDMYSDYEFQQQGYFQPAGFQRQQPMPAAQMSPAFAERVRRLIDRFVRTDRMFIDVVDRVKRIGTADRVWQTLLEHITMEQRYMLRLMRTLRAQIR